MKKSYFNIILVLMSLSVFSCAKNTDSQNCPPIEVSVPQNEITGLESFLEDQGIEALWHEKGFYYTILKEGNGATPNACSDINIAYEGSLTNGFVFDANDGIDFPLTKLITGWRLGVPLLKEGGEIILYLPPTLGYGSNAQANIPANSILIFQIELHKVK
ncbi:MAG TPA: FKBP-type peptidyl-prolyl cis-trans isomerase [Chitinophagaceae bacterium]|nr:FKBP-type peptidyl-prolyl cis-trans isomerase [Chitinophagaceae bacterium]